MYRAWATGGLCLGSVQTALLARWLGLTLSHREKRGMCADPPGIWQPRGLEQCPGQAADWRTVYTGESLPPREDLSEQCSSLMWDLAIRAPRLPVGNLRCFRFLEKQRLQCTLTRLAVGPGDLHACADGRAMSQKCSYRA